MATATAPSELVTVKRVEFLHALESVRPGVAPSPLVLQSTCFAFQNGRIYTFNDEVACRVKSGLPKDLECAVQADPLLRLLGKTEVDEVRVGVRNGKFLVVAKEAKSRIVSEATIRLPFDTVERPEEWKPLPADFIEAVTIVKECAGKDEGKFSLTCVHVHPKWVEACDRYQLTRYSLETGFSKSTYIRAESVKHILPLDMVEFSETPKWVHFRNGNGLMLSCRQYVEEVTYPPVGKWLKMEGGVPSTLPKGLGQTAERGDIFSSDTESKKNQLHVVLKDNEIVVTGRGDSGEHVETKGMNYAGPAIEFSLSPKLLMELSKRYTECEITPDRLRVDGGRFVYVTSLGLIEEASTPEGGGD